MSFHGAPATILGGLPVWAEVSFGRGDGWTTDDWAEVEGLYWLTRKGKKGAPLSQKILDRLDKIPYWQADVTEQVSEAAAAEYWEAQEYKAEQRRDEQLLSNWKGE